VPLVKPVTVQGLAEHDTEPAGDPVTVYPVIADPPLFTGAVKLTFTELPDVVAATPVGGSGTVAGVIEADATDSALLPTAFVACTVNVYAVPLVRPVTVQGLLEHDTEPAGEPVTV
jgi:hypothetical protein